MSKKIKKFYAIEAKQQGSQPIAELRIYDEIGFWGVTAKEFVQQLNAAAAEAEKIVVSINSPGGNVFDAFAIYNALVRHDLPVETRIDGVAASAASLVFMAGTERIMPENAMLMIHNAWIITAGTADELRNTAEMMDKVRDGIVAAYARSGEQEGEIIKMMNETTWMSALDAQSMGFCTMLENPVKIAASMNTVEVLERLKNTPQELLDLLAKSTKEDPKDRAKPDVELSANELVSYALSACQEAGLASLAEAVLMSGAMKSKETIEARVKEADEIATLCASAKLSEKAADFVKAGLNVDQVRARLFDAVVNAADSITISNLQRETEPTISNTPTATLNPTTIWAARRAAITK